MRQAAYTIAGICCCVLVYHTLIITGVIPYAYVWGGRLETAAQMYRFEAFSVMINLLIVFITLMRINIVPQFFSERIVARTTWVLAHLLFANTIANIFSESLWEAIIFTPITAILGFMCLRLSKES